MTKVNADDLVADSENVPREVCEVCKALIVHDHVTGEAVCGCPDKGVESVAQQVAAAKEMRQAASVQPTEEQVTTPQPGSAPTDVVPQSDVPVFSAKELLKTLPNAPSQEQIDAWKQEHGCVYTFPFDMRTLYLWRPMRRREWQTLQAQEALVADQSKFQDQVVMRCVLWPKLDPVALNITRAGTIPTLFGIIMQGSYFLEPEIALRMVEEL